MPLHQEGSTPDNDWVVLSINLQAELWALDRHLVSMRITTPAYRNGICFCKHGMA